MRTTPRGSPIPDPFEGDPSGGLFGGPGGLLSGDRWRPLVDVFETADAIVVRAELPGVRGEDLRVRIDGEVLHISGVRSVPKDPRVLRLHRMEVAFGPFERAVKLPAPCDHDAIEARLEDGFLRVVLPCRHSSRRRVDVETE